MLKSSHLVTPRSMAEATWLHACDPIEPPEPKPRGLGRWVAFAMEEVQHADARLINEMAGSSPMARAVKLARAAIARAQGEQE